MLCRIVLVLLVLFQLIGCSSNQHLKSIPLNERIKFVSHELLSKEKVVLSINDKEFWQNLKNKENVDATSNFFSALSCGPFYGFCASKKIPMGDLITENVSGTQENTNSITLEQLSAIKKVNKSLSETTSFELRLLEKVTETTRKNWRINEEGSNHVITLTLKKASVFLLANHQMSLGLSLNVSSQNKETGRSNSRRFYYRSPLFPIDSWIKNKHNFVEHRFEHAYLILSLNIESEIK